MSIRPIKYQSVASFTTEGAGVRLHRAFGFGDPSMTDPFLMLDDFRNEKPEEYIRGFPWHPHRGIETVTYVLAGAVEHGDHFLLVSGWHGPIVMNSREEIRQAMRELQNGTFIKSSH